MVGIVAKNTRQDAAAGRIPHIPQAEKHAFRTDEQERHSSTARRDIARTDVGDSESLAEQALARREPGPDHPPRWAALRSATRYGTGSLPKALSTVPPAVNVWVTQSAWP